MLRNDLQVLESNANWEEVVVIAVVSGSKESASETTSVNMSVPMTVSSVNVAVAARFVMDGLLPVQNIHLLKMKIH